MKILNKLTTEVLKKIGNWGIILSIGTFLISLLVMIWTATMSWPMVGTVLVTLVLSIGIWLLADSGLWGDMTRL